MAPLPLASSTTPAPLASSTETADRGRLALEKERYVHDFGDGRRDLGFACGVRKRELSTTRRRRYLSTTRRRREEEGPRRAVMLSLGLRPATYGAGFQMWLRERGGRRGGSERWHRLILLW
ncbi:unnamed protein product [Linum trigynum]|uniref:Uncharacterized protein n=1 Tax=Linum trigynum TaxID=586398 RepID=A0AAV2F906_9ROSI